MLKTIVKFEHTIGDKTGQFFVDHDTPIEIAKEIVLKFLHQISSIEEQVQARLEAEKAKSQMPQEGVPTQDHCIEEEKKDEEAVA